MDESQTIAKPGAGGSRRVLFMLVAFTLAIAIPLTLVEICLRLTGPKRVHGIVVPDPVLHHAHEPGSMVRVESITREFGGFEMAFDEDGCRVDPKSAATMHGSEPMRIAVLGDSFVEAAQLPCERSFVGQLEAALRGRAWVRNYGVSSFSPVLELLQWRTKTSAWKPTHVILMLYWNDVDRSGEVADADYLEKAVRDTGGEITAIPGEVNPVMSVLNHLHLKWEITRAFKTAKFRLDSMRSGTKTETDGTFAEPNPHMGDPTAGLILKLKAEVEQSGAKFILTAVPSKGRHLGHIQSEEPEFADKVKAWAAASALDYIDITPPFRAKDGKSLFFKEDIHFNPAGHEAVARILIDSFAQKDLLLAR